MKTHQDEKWEIFLAIPEAERSFDRYRFFASVIAEENFPSDLSRVENIAEALSLLWNSSSELTSEVKRAIRLNNVRQAMANRPHRLY